MRIISKKKLREYYKDNAQSEIPLTEWYYRMQLCSSRHFAELKNVFNAVDAVHGYTVFNVGGNSYRLVTAIHYNTQCCYIRVVWTHAEYSKSTHQKKLKEGAL